MEDVHLAPHHDPRPSKAEPYAPLRNGTSPGRCDGQVAQISRRPGSNVVFLTLRDPSADLSLTV
ncbi:hypothetical protein, partial [Actinoplanes philippinensis]|uniref:hypothetical protein n=1 Tax=Actinoplanes philippinensis TaxID=35752 RepID=UPI0033C9CE4B